MVKEIRLAGVSTLEAGDALLPAFMADYNARFAKPLANAKDLHRPMGPRERLETPSAGRSSGLCRSR